MSLAHYDHIAQVVRAAHKAQPTADDESIAGALQQQHPTMPFSHILAWVKQYRPAQQQPQPQRGASQAKPQGRNAMPSLSNNAATARKAATISHPNAQQYVKTIATKRKETPNCAVYQSRALGSTYIPMVNFPEGEPVPERIEITITKA